MNKAVKLKLLVLRNKPDLCGQHLSTEKNTMSLEDFIHHSKKKVTKETPVWHVQLNEGLHALTIHSSSKLLGQIWNQIEDEAVELLCKSFENHREPNERPEIKLNLQEEQIAQQKKKKKETKTDASRTFYPGQENVGAALHRKIREKIGDDFDLFDSIKFVILVPNRKSLENQTRTRLEDLQKDQVFLDRRDIKSSVIRITINAPKMMKRWKDFIEEAKTNPTTLFLVIHDECHWAAGEGETYKFLGFGDCKPSECKSGKCKHSKCCKMECESNDYHKDIPNIFTMMVSATPYSILVMKNIQDENFVNWHSVHKEEAYKGLTKLRKEEKIKTSLSAQKLKEILTPHSISILTNNGYKETFILVLMDYLASLFGLSCGSLVEYLQKCISENKLVVFRLNKAKGKISEARLAKKVLEKGIKMRKIQNLEVLVNSEEKEEENDKRDEKQEEEDNEDENLKTNNRNSFKTFSEVNNKAMIMIIIERGRLGDTFSPNCIAFDLRARYTSPVTDFSPIIQDAGRAFGYGERPTLFLSEEADTFLKKVWNEETDSLNEETFKKETEFLLDKHMKRIINSGKSEQSATFANDLADDLRAETTDELLRLIRAFFRPDESKPVFLNNLGADSFRNRIILKAQPQVGKTGAFLNLISRLIGHFENVKNDGKNQTKDLYVLKDLSEIKRLGNDDHEKFRKRFFITRQRRKLKGELEPSHCAAQMLIRDVKETLKNKNDDIKEVLVADFGCLDMVFARHLDAEIRESDQQIRNLKYTVHGFDISPLPIEAIDTEFVKGIPHPSINCGEKTNFEADKFDYIISTLALFGARGTWKETLKAAFFALKPGGKLYLVERGGYYNLQLFHRALNDSGISWKTFSWQNDNSDDEADSHNDGFGEEEADERKRKRENQFLTKYIALVCKKTKKFKIQKLEKNLNQFKRTND